MKLDHRELGDVGSEALAQGVDRLALGVEADVVLLQLEEIGSRRSLPKGGITTRGGSDQGFCRSPRLRACCSSRYFHRSSWANVAKYDLISSCARLQGAAGHEGDLAVASTVEHGEVLRLAHLP